MQKYNLVYKGNALLQNERYHTVNLRYLKMNLYRGITWNGMASFTEKVKTIRNEIQLDGINQFNSPILRDDPETNYNVNGFVTKKIYRFSLRINTSLGWYNYFQTLHNAATSNDSNNQEIGVLLKKVPKKWPDFSIGYAKGFGQFSGLTKSNFKRNAVTTDADVTFLKFWTYKFSYENLKKHKQQQSK